jgi:hypothetical protein
VSDADLESAFERARAAVTRSARHAEEQPGTCRYCGLAWRKYAGTALDGHSSCWVTPAFLDEMAGHASRCSLSAIAARLGVSTSCVRGWFKMAKRRADNRRLAALTPPVTADRLVADARRRSGAP